MYLRNLSNPDRSGHTGIEMSAQVVRAYSVMQELPVNGHVSGLFEKAAATALLACALLMLAGCQGFSSGSTHSQTQPGAIALSSSNLSFGSVTVGKKQSTTETVTNSGGSTLTISLIQITGAEFTMSGITAPMTLTAGQSANLSVSFSPSTSGTASGSISIAYSGDSTPVTIPLSGTGAAIAVGQLTVNPTTLGLGSVMVGNSGSSTGTLTASGADVTITAAGINSSVFSLSGLSLPVTISAGNSASFTVTFSPQSTGAVSGTLTFTSNAQTASTKESLTGTGLAVPTHSVNLSWNASTSSNISGYNIYRAVYQTGCGSYSKINGVLNTGTLYTDATVANGKSYCYAATSVDTSNQESSYSNIVSNVQIPAQ